MGGDSSSSLTGISPHESGLPSGAHQLDRARSSRRFHQSSNSSSSSSCRDQRRRRPWFSLYSAVPNSSSVTRARCSAQSACTAQVQRQVVAEQADAQAMFRLDCRSCWRDLPQLWALAGKASIQLDRPFEGRPIFTPRALARSRPSPVRMRICTKPMTERPASQYILEVFLAEFHLNGNALVPTRGRWRSHERRR